MVEHFLLEMNTAFPGHYTTDTWLELFEVAQIILTGDQSIYPHQKAQYYFDSNNRILRIKNGFYKSNGSFSSQDEIYNIDFNTIIGFVLRQTFINKGV